MLFFCWSNPTISLIVSQLWTIFLVKVDCCLSKNWCNRPLSIVTHGVSHYHHHYFFVIFNNWLLHLWWMELFRSCSQRDCRHLTRIVSMLFCWLLIFFFVGPFDFRWPSRCGFYFYRSVAGPKTPQNNEWTMVFCQTNATTNLIASIANCPLGKVDCRVQKIDEIAIVASIDSGRWRFACGRRCWPSKLLGHCFKQTWF